MKRAFARAVAGSGPRFGDQFCDPEAKQNDAHQRGDGSGSRTVRLDEVHPADDLVVLLLSVRQGAFAEKELICFMLGQRSTVDHQTDKHGDADAPNDGSNV